MGKTRLALLIVACMAGGAAHAQSTVYRWVDKDGKVHFTDAPPPPDAVNATQARVGGGGNDDSSLPYALQQAIKRNPITLYVSKTCDLCDEARALLTQRGIPYAERNIETSPADADKVREVVGTLSVPLMMLGDKPVKGFEEGIWNATLDSAGYPRTRLPGVGGPRAEPGTPAK